MKQYVLGFLFNSHFDVVLIEKAKPAHMAGLLNGVGGHIEDRLDETPMEAMHREFFEETGVKGVQWEPFATLLGARFSMYCFKAFGYQEFYDAKTKEAEEIVKVSAKKLPDNVMYNLRWLIPMALDSDVRETQIIKVS